MVPPEVIEQYARGTVVQVQEIQLLHPVPLEEQVGGQRGSRRGPLRRDPLGEAMAWRVTQQLPGVKRLTPAYDKDWNERLVQDRYPEQATQSKRNKQLMHSLWQ